MLLKKVAIVAALVTCTAAQADTAPSYRYLQGSVERISQSGEDSLTDTGFGLEAAWQFNNNWFIAAEWQRFTDTESFTDTFNDERVEVSLELSLDRYYVGGGYVMPISDVTNISFAGYFGAYRLAADGRVRLYVDNQLMASMSTSDSSTKNSLKAEVALRSNINSKLELSGRAYYEYLNADLDDNSQYGVGAGAQYHFTPAFALTSEISHGKLLDENTTQLSAGIRYHF